MSGFSDAGSPGDPAKSSALPNMAVDLTADVAAVRSAVEVSNADAPVRWREILGIVAFVAVCDVTIYRGHGYAGYALLFAAAPPLLWLSSPERRAGRGMWIVSLMLIALAGKLLWCGSGPLVGIGFSLLVAFAMTLVGLTPHVVEAISFALQTFQSGFWGIGTHCRRVDMQMRYEPRSGWGALVAPVLVFLIFGWIFVLANPDLLQAIGERFATFAKSIDLWLRQFAPDFWELWFWVAAWWLAIGLLRPRINRAQYEFAADEDTRPGERGSPLPHLYPMFRNTLVTVAVLFAVYLPFEFGTLWFREFPEGFHYSGYAHEGAAWLTIALALATVILSMVFRGNISRDPRIGVLRKLAWLWSLENLLLAAAIYHRLFIYVGFNGMTRMRIVGLYGISAVLVGFFIVIWKIVYQRNFLWLVRRQLLTLAIALYLLAMTPLDTIVVGYNVKRIFAGDPAPAVQISVHPINSEGILLLMPLLESDNEIIREGVRALLAEYYQRAEEVADMREKQGWTTFQFGDQLALGELRKGHSALRIEVDSLIREERLKQFHDYVYQWY
ncbi:MAG: DUF4153 domain-containing protein [Planctomycetaceae bacterium]